MSYCNNTILPVVRFVDKDDKYNIPTNEFIFDGSWIGDSWAVEIHNYYTRTYSCILFDPNFINKHKIKSKIRLYIPNLKKPVLNKLEMIETVLCGIETRSFEKPNKLTHEEFTKFIRSGNPNAMRRDNFFRIQGLFNIFNIHSKGGKLGLRFVNLSLFNSKEDILEYLGYCKVVIEKELSYGRKRKKEGYTFID